MAATTTLCLRSGDAPSGALSVRLNNRKVGGSILPLANRVNAGHRAP
jgi:hypothetical protein